MSCKIENEGLKGIVGGTASEGAVTEPELKCEHCGSTDCKLHDDMGFGITVKCNKCSRLSYIKRKA